MALSHSDWAWPKYIHGLGILFFFFFLTFNSLLLKVRKTREFLPSPKGNKREKKGKE